MGKRQPQRSPAPLAMLLASVLVTICLLLWMVQNAITTNKNDSLVGGNSKRMTLTPLSPSCVGSDSRRFISPSLTTTNFSVRRRMMPSPPSKAASPLALPAPLSAPYGNAHRASYAKTRKERQDPRSRKSSLRNAPRPLPCHRHHALGELHLLPSPTIQRHGDPRHHLRHPLPALHRRVRHHRLIPGCLSPITTFKHAKKLPLAGEFFHSADAEIILRS